jgi:ATP-dependent Clp protease ATP-binding subunit ClpB
VDLLTEELRRRLAERDIQLVLSEPARELIARKGFDPVFGARPLRRFLQHELESRIGRALVGGEANAGATIRVDVKGGEIAVAIENPEPERAAKRA